MCIFSHLDASGSQKNGGPIHCWFQSVANNSDLSFSPTGGCPESDARVVAVAISAAVHCGSTAVGASV